MIAQKSNSDGICDQNKWSHSSDRMKQKEITETTINKRDVDTAPFRRNKNSVECDTVPLR